MAGVPAATFATDPSYSQQLGGTAIDIVTLVAIAYEVVQELVRLQAAWWRGACCLAAAIAQAAYSIVMTGAQRAIQYMLPCALAGNNLGP